MTQLTKEELQGLINIVSEVNIPVKQSGTFVQLINKMSKMIDEVKQLPKEKDGDN